MASMTIGELAEQVHMTPRNIRAYQSRGLLAPPEIRGRVAYYSGGHAARLALVAALQREGFSLAAVKRLLDSPSSFSAIVSDRRRRAQTGEDDLPVTVPVSEEVIRSTFPDAAEAFVETGLVWHDGQDRLVSSTVLVGVGRALLDLGVPAASVAALQTEAVRAGRAVGAVLDAAGNAPADDDIARVAVQLAATAFEMGFLAAAASRPPADD